jgi:hypothetical protein
MQISEERDFVFQKHLLDSDRKKLPSKYLECGSDSRPKWFGSKILELNDPALHYILTLLESRLSPEESALMLRFVLRSYPFDIRINIKIYHQSSRKYILKVTFN